MGRRAYFTNQTGARNATVSMSAELDNIFRQSRLQVIRTIQRLVNEKGFNFAAKQKLFLLKEVDKVFGKMGGNMEEWGARNIPYSINSYFNMAVNDLGIEASVLGGLNERRIALAMGNWTDEIAANTKFMATMEKRHLRRISADIFREASLTGQTRAAVSAQLESRALELPSFKFIDKAGKQWNTEAYFKMLGRTVLHNQGREMYIDSMQARGKDLARITVSGNSCPACNEWENRIVSVSGTNPDYPALDKAVSRGLFHPNCVHSLVYLPPVVREKRYLDDGSGRPKDGLNSYGNTNNQSKDKWRDYRKNHEGVKGKWKRTPLENRP